MKHFEIALIVFVCLVAIAIFFALLNFLGGYGALISAFLFAGLVNECAEKKESSK